MHVLFVSAVCWTFVFTRLIENEKTYNNTLSYIHTQIVIT